MPRLQPGRRMLIQADAISVRQGGREVLHSVDLTVAPGEIVTIVGPNGSGKTTLLRAMLGAVPLSGGEVRRKPGLRIGYVPQKLHLDPTLPMSVRRFLSLPRRVGNDVAQDALARAGVGDLGPRMLSELSGGQLQRVLLARALIGSPDVLMLDEPTTGLDQPGQARFYQLLEQLAHAQGCAVLMVSHELHVVMSASDRVICLNGHVCCQGTPEHVSSAPAYRELFGTGTGGALALYRHHHTDSCGHSAEDHNVG